MVGLLLEGGGMLVRLSCNVILYTITCIKYSTFTSTKNAVTAYIVKYLAVCNEFHCSRDISDDPQVATGYLVAIF